MTREDLYEQYAQKVVDDMSIDDLMTAVQEHITERLLDTSEPEALKEIEESTYSDLLDEYEGAKP